MSRRPRQLSSHAPDKHSARVGLGKLLAMAGAASLVCAQVLLQLVSAAPAQNVEGASAPAAPAGKAKPALTEKALLCDVAYLPTRSNWVRRVELGLDRKKIQTVRIDGLAVYSFALSGTTIVTALDNERIQLDVAQLSWTSDLRGVASGQGRCELEPAAR